MRFPLLLIALTTACTLHAQTISNTAFSDGVVADVLRGVYDPSLYAANVVVDDHATILCELRTAISPDSLKAHLEAIVGFHNRNTFSDTVSNTHGIGAARRWAFQRFAAISTANDGRLLPAYLGFDYEDPECGTLYGTRNVMAVLPGRSLADSGIVIIEAHMDSRCANNCDTACLAQGADDNGSGCALVLELARVLSRYTFDHTLVFMLTTGEEHGLVGAAALARWCTQQGVPIKGVQNNDVVGGIWCGATSSDPGCEVENEADSLEVRLFSQGTTSKPHRGFARTIKLYYEEKMRDQVPVPMDITVMPMEDRENRGGDHIPFREEGFRNVRFTAAHEHGDANVTDTAYHDRQHTSDDILGVDTDGDLVVDSFFVDFNYLQRNTVINGMTTVLLALGPEPPAFTVNDEPTGLRLDVIPSPELMAWRVGVRQGNTANTFTALYRTDQTSFLVPGLLPTTTYYISMAGIDSAGVMSPFSPEVVKQNDAVTPAAPQDELPFGLACAPISIPEIPWYASQSELLCAPNPALAGTRILISAPGSVIGKNASLHVRDAMGRSVFTMPLPPSLGDANIAVEAPSSPGLYSISICGPAMQGSCGRVMVVE